MAANLGEFADVVMAQIGFASSTITRHRDVANNSVKKRKPTEDEIRMDEGFPVLDSPVLERILISCWEEKNRLKLEQRYVEAYEI
ncbi:hypothetical protein RIF29_10666 [Crotalaria pallida]|uniref:Uncharacterized protein n=1 Tax=Crotalaria pallida TaxID=3830 RepID=A0AAN9ILS2_CROPI